MSEEKGSRFAADSDVQQGMREVGAEVAQGRAGLFVGRGPGGFALIAGAVGAGTAEVGHGHMIAVSLTVGGLKALRDRIDSLLKGNPTPPLRVVL
jgi:hypothetical protein